MLKTILTILTLLFVVPFLASAHETPDIISMTPEGFEPKEVEIHFGEIIIFQNNDTRDRWPASNFHPTHSLYSEFDPQEPVEPGTSWSFKFEREGVWRMHDHLFPHMTGTITVLPGSETNSEPILEKRANFKSLLSGIWQAAARFFNAIINSLKNIDFKKELSLETHEVSAFAEMPESEKYEFLKEVSAQSTPETAWAYVKQAYNTPRGVVGNPHDLAHLVGQLLFKERGLNGLATCEPIFAFGCYHGLMEVAFTDKGLSELPQAEKSCEEIEDKMTIISCIHGIGHGLATYESHDIKKSLGDCEILKPGLQVYCYDGVFMEFMISAPPSFYMASRPLSPCDELDQKYHSACGRSIPQTLRSRYNRSNTEIAKTCSASKSQDLRFHCIDSLGYSIGQQSGGKADYIVKNCGDIQAADANAQCVTAAAGELVFQNYQDWQTQAYSACDSLQEAFIAGCTERVNKVKTDYKRN